MDSAEEPGYAAGVADILGRLGRLDVAMIRLDAGRRIVGWEGAAERVFGFSAEEAIGFRPEALPVTEKDMALRLRATLLGAPERPLEHDMHMLRKDGTAFPARTRASLDYNAAGEVVGSCILVLDTSAVRHADEGAPTVDSLGPVAELGTLAIGGIEREDLADRAVTIVADSLAVDLVGVFAVDSDARELVLESGSGWLGEPRIPLTSPEMTAILGNGRPVISSSADRGYLPGGGVLEAAGARDGLSVPIGDPHRPQGALVAFSSSARRFSAHEIEFLQATSHVLSAAGERGRARELEARFQRLSRIEAMGQLTGGIAHDFNNLLGVILNYTGFARQEAREGAGVEHSLDEIEGAARRAAELTHQLLVFSRQDVVAVEPVDVTAAVASAERMLARTLGEGIELATELEDGLRPIEAGPGQIEQIIINLAVNSRDAMPEGGTVRITVSRAGREDSTYRWIRVTVNDDGIGMSAPVLEKAFEPFFTTKPVGEGSGLGLATVYGIVSALGGSIEIGSEPGVGTDVDILLPLSETADATRDVLGAESPPAAERAAGQESGAPAPRVLLVEDDDMVRRLTVRVLGEAGFEVVEAGGGGQALELAAGGAGADADVLLTDVVMPGMSGVELAARIRELLPAIRVVFMSGYTGDSVSPEAVRDLDAGFVEKPFTPETLVATVSAAFAQA